MNSKEKEISYTTTNSYSTLNTLTKATKNVWLVCHGMGYLSRYFLKYFKGLDADENYIIAPQASSKYYLDSKFKRVGASWLTKENTVKDTVNILQYFDAIFDTENIPSSVNIIVFGYSQGVSIATRYVAKRQLQCSKLILHSGGIPNELETKDFDFFKGEVHFIYGKDDHYLNEERIKHETDKAHKLFGDATTIIPFDGVHEVNTEIINKLA